MDILSPVNFYRFNLDFISFIESLEEEMDRKRLFDQKDLREKSILISVSKKPKYEQEESLEELKELALERCACRLMQ